MFALAAGWYVTYRTWGSRAVGPVAPPAAWNQVASVLLPVDQNAAELYLNLPKAAHVTEFLQAEANVIERTLDLPRSTLHAWLLISTPDQAPADRAMGATLLTF